MDNNQNNDQLPTENAQPINPEVVNFNAPVTPPAQSYPSQESPVLQPVAPQPVQPEAVAPVVATEPVVAEQPVKPKKSHKLVIVAIIVVVVLAGLVAGYLLINK